MIWNISLIRTIVFTHFTCNEEKKHTVLFSSYRSNSRGVAILFLKNSKFKVKNLICDTVGNFLILGVQIENKDFLSVSGTDET